MKIARSGVNSIFVVGEVVDFGISPRKKGIDVRVRLKLRTNSKKGSIVYLDVYGKRSTADVMTLTCQIGNIVFVEGEFRNASIEKRLSRVYVLAKHVECLLRKKEVTAPSAKKIIRLLNELDPMGYVEDIMGGKNNG